MVVGGSGGEAVKRKALLRPSDPYNHLMDDAGEGKT